MFLAILSIICGVALATDGGYNTCWTYNGTQTASSLKGETEEKKKNTHRRKTPVQKNKTKFSLTLKKDLPIGTCVRLRAREIFNLRSTSSISMSEKQKH